MDISSNPASKIRHVSNLQSLLNASGSTLPVLFSKAGCFFYHADVCELPAPSVPLDMVIDNTVFQNVFRTGHDVERATGMIDFLQRS